MNTTAGMTAPDSLETASRRCDLPPRSPGRGDVDGNECDNRWRRSPTLRQQMLRRRRIAMVTILVSLGIGCRWHVANLEPTYPVGEGVYTRSAIPDAGASNQPDAAMFYMAAADAFDVDIPSCVGNGSVGLIDQPLAIQKSVVAQAQPAFALLRQGMKHEFMPDRCRGYFMAASPSPGGPLRPRNFAPIRDMSRLLITESRVREADGDTFGALQSSLDAMRLGTDCTHGRSLLDGMVGVLSQNIGAREALRHVDGLSATEARAGASRLETMLKRERSVAQMMTDERDTLTYDSLRWVFRTRTLQGLHPSNGEINLHGAPWRFALGVAIFVRTKQGIVNDFAEQHDRILARMKMPYQLAKRLNTVPPSANPVVRYWVGHDFARAYFQSVRQSAQNRVLLTRLAVQAYRQEHKGTAPASLTELTVGPKPYLSAVPNDPFSLTGSYALRYRADTGTVYSVGSNGVDEKNFGDDHSGL